MEALKCAYDSSESENDGDQQVDVTKKHIASSTEPERKRRKAQPCHTKDVSSFTLRGISRDQPHGQSTKRKFEEAGGCSLSFQSHIPNVATDMAMRQHRLHAVTQKITVEQSQWNSPKQRLLTPNITARQSAALRNKDHTNIRRYIPKREREKSLTANTSVAAQPLPYNKQCNTEGNVHQNQQEFLSVSNKLASPNRTPKKVLVEFKGHTKGVNCVRWCPQKADLLLSASMDHSVNLWDVHGGQCVRKLEHHDAAVKDARWSHCGTRVLSCGYDKMARITDVQTGQELQHLVHKNYATCVQYHPTDPNLFLVGTFKSNILCWDSRSAQIVSTYSAFFGQVQDLAFLPGGDAFVSAAEVVRRNSTDKGIMVWDFRSTAILSNQIYQEAFTCTCLRVHPSEAHFVAQSSGDYVAIFSTKRPYKLNKLKRYEGHKVSGFHIGCDFSPDGSIIASGSSDGNVYFYNQHTSRIIKTISAHSMACMDVAYHPSFPSTVASCSWDGTVVVWE